MSIYAIQQYHKELEKIIHFGGSKKETAIRNAFYYLLNEYAHTKDLMLIAEISTKNKQGKIITPDGTLKDNIRNDWGYWESKDEKDDIDEEITNKFAIGYPADNILFEDSQTAVLFQHGDEVMRVDMKNEEALHSILTFFLSYERPEVHDFREAIEKFKEDIPKVTVAIREIIEAQQKTNTELQKAQADFLTMAKASINPEINEDDVKEMMIQHILSADIFNTIFDEAHFHQENNIARELNKVIDTFFTGTVRRQTLGNIKHYYDTINARAASIADHHEKQKFLKVVYENFYKGYNPRAADRLGIVYTPNEIVNFMIRSTDYLLHKHFGKTLGDKNVEILDPATGTGTFITDIIDYLPKNKLAHKYKNELHANEVAILPYYIANLNIEYTYKQKMGSYAEFDNLCFVDTLDNTGFNWVGKQGDLFGVTAENAQRIKRQNERKISVVIGNPPYNAKQENYNNDNANRLYKEIDKRIKETYVKHGTAQNQNIVYDMYTRFYRWAMDRLNENGVIAFITNRSFIEGRAFDGFRKTIQEEFDHVYLIDTLSDVRVNPKIAGSTHNVFGIQTGIAVMFLVKTSYKQLKMHTCKIDYISQVDSWRKEQKLQWFVNSNIEKVEFENITPDKNNNWINQTDNDWDSLLPVITKEGKAGKTNEVIFQMFSAGVQTSRDEWVFDSDLNSLKSKISYFKEVYNNSVEAFKIKGTKENLKSFENGNIKWSSSLEQYLLRSISFCINDNQYKYGFYRPFFKQNFYYDKIVIHRVSLNHKIFGVNLDKPNNVISFMTGIAKPFSLLGINCVCDVNFLSPAAGGTYCLPLSLYNSKEKLDNITDWAVQQFTDHYTSEDKYWDLQKDFIEYDQSKYPEGALTPASFFQGISKEDIFHYVYAVLHNPVYRKKYELNLKREFPRIPLYKHFYSWVKWGEQLMNLHINYETVKVYPLKIITTDVSDANAATLEKLQKPKLKADKTAGTIELDGITILTGIPAIAWQYKLGNRSALEWILDQYKEKKPKDPTIAEKFNTYKFADYKDQVIDLLMKVCRVSVETKELIGEMEKVNEG